MADKPRTSLSLPRVSPMASEDQAALAQRIDRVVMELESYLKQFSAPDTQKVDGTPAEDVTQNRFSDVFTQTFEDPIEDFWLLRRGDRLEISYPTDGTTGGHVFQKKGVGFFEYPNNIPYDETRVYRLRGRAYGVDLTSELQEGRSGVVGNPVETVDWTAADSDVVTDESISTFNLSPGDDFTFAVEVRSETGADEVEAVVEFWDSGGSQIVEMGSGGLTTDTFVTERVLGTVPANAATIRIRVSNRDTTETAYRTHAALVAGEQDSSIAWPFDVFRWGVQGIRQDGATVADRVGGQDPLKPHVFGASHRFSDTDTGQGNAVDFTAYVTGTSDPADVLPGDSDSPSSVHPDAAYIRPWFEVNSSSPSTMAVDYIAIDVLTLAAELDALALRNAPAESGADVTAEKSMASLTARFFENLVRSSDDGTKLDIVVSKIDNAGDLTQFTLFDDGADKRVLVKGAQTGVAADGEAVTFDPNFQDTPNVIVMPGGLISDPNIDTANNEVVDKVQVSGLSASGFTLIAKLVERDVTVTVNSDSFPAGTLTGDDTAGQNEGQTLALGGLSGDADDDEYRAFYDGSLAINSADTIQDEQDDFAAGVLDAAGESLTCDLTDVANNDAYDVTVNVDLSVVAAEGSTTVQQGLGLMSSDGDTTSVSLNDSAHDGVYTAQYDVSYSGTGFLTVFLESRESGGSWDTRDQKTHSASVSDATLSFTDSSLGTNDDVRLRLAESTASPSSVSGDHVSYDTRSYDAKKEVDVVFESSTNDGGTWATESTQTYTVHDTDGTGDAMDTDRIVGFTQAGATDLRVRISDIRTTGAPSSSDVAIDPKYAEYTSGSAETATIQVKLALDSKDGTGAWVERDTSTHNLTDSDGSGKSKTLTGENMSFADSAIDNGDDIRIRVKGVQVSGGTDSWSYSIDPDRVDFSTFSSSVTEHSKTPQPGDGLRWIAFAA